VGGSCSMHRDMRNLYKVLVGQRQGKRPLGRPGHIWRDDIRMDLKKKQVGAL